MQKHADIVPHILAAHSISGCDTVSSLYGIGKPTVINALQRGNIELPSIGNLSSPFADVIREGLALFLRYYGHTKLSTMTEARIRTLMKRVGADTAPLLESPLPIGK